MYSFLNKNGQALAFGVGLLISVIFLAIIFADPQTANIATMDDQAKFSSKMFDFGLAMSMALTILAVAGMLFFGVAHVASNPKGSIKGLIGFGLVAVLMFITYSVTSGEPDHPTVATAIEKFESSQSADLTAGNLKFISGSILTSLILLVLSFVALIGFGIRSFFK